MNNLPQPITHLTLSQEFQLSQMVKSLDKMNRKELEEMLTFLLKNDMILRANIAQLVKRGLG